MAHSSSIRSKITFWFYLLLSFMIASSVITYGVVRAVEERLFNIERVDTFLEDILEVRRMEKNYLLYNDQNSMDQWTAYLEATSQQLESNKELFINLSSLSDIREVQKALREYQATFATFHNNPRDVQRKSSILREQGNKLTTLAEKLILREHNTVHRLLALTRNSLLFALPLLVLFFSFIAGMLGKGIVSSLRRLEQHAATIAAGDFVERPLVSTNQEVNSLINALNQMSRELKVRQQQLVRSEKLASLGIMLAGVAHEFNNPLSNISSSAQILGEEIDGEKGSFAQELIRQIGAETSRASAIVNTLLSLAREEKFHRDHYPLKSLCQEILNLIRGQVASDIEIEMTISDEIVIFADKQKIQQVFINLLKNSADAMAGKGTIYINASQDLSGLTITVCDDGPGIPEQIQGKIFDPFFSTKDTGDGSGLGLFIVHDIIVQHGGIITVGSNNGEGTIFTIIMPRREIS